MGKTGGERRWANFKGDTKDITVFMPHRANVVCDDDNGRFLISHKAIVGSRGSISWTKRGNVEAVRLALVQLWAWDRTVGGPPCPLPAALIAPPDAGKALGLRA